MYKVLFKSLMDRTLALGALLVLLPVMLVTAALVRLEDGGPVFYDQWRLGRHGKEIKIRKFRSMSPSSTRVPSKDGQVFNDSAEVTRVGRWIRRLKIDELPQLLSVLVGDLALIGPRPCLPDLKEKFDDNGRKRLEVLPGCTGLAQVHGNIYLSWPERWRYDAYYVDHQSFLLDMIILWKTLAVLTRGEARLATPFDDFLKHQVPR